jgi:hypothetical protein
MITIAIEYRPVNILSITRRKELSLPEHWRELTPVQLENIGYVFSGAMPEVRQISLFLGVSLFFATRLDSWQRFCILKQLRFLNSIEICDRFIIPKIGKLKGPKPLLQNVTFGAFMFGDTYFQQWLEGNKIEDLNKFIACFYTNDKFFDDKIESDSAYISKKSMAKRDAIALNYKLIREWLGQSYPFVFEKVDQEDKKKPSKGWVGVFDAVVGDDLVNQERYAEKPLSQVLRFLNRKRKEYLKSNRHGR